MRVRNLLWALLFIVPGTLLANDFANADVAYDHSALVQLDVDSQADAVNLEEGATDEWGWGGGWGFGRCGGWGWGWGGWGYPFFYGYPWLYGSWGWGGGCGWGGGWGGGWGC